MCHCHSNDVEVSEPDSHLCVFTHARPSVAGRVNCGGHTITPLHWATLIFFQHEALRKSQGQAHNIAETPYD